MLKGRYLVLIVLALLFMAGTVSAATSEITVKKLASDGTTVLDEVTVNYTWMATNLPVYGDGVTHYYHQGPVFVDDPDEATEQALRWNPEEDTNVLTKDMGAVKGTNVKDLCELVGGMNAGEDVLVKAEDGLSRPFAYENVYGYSNREGPMVITWYVDGLSSYPSESNPDTGYSDGMRLVWITDNSTNPWGVHAFGNYDWYLAADESYWYYYYSGPEKYPTTTGLSVKYVSEIIILSDDPAPMDVLYDGTVTLTPGETFNVTAYNSGTTYTLNETTPLGALEATGLTYNVTDKRWSDDQVLLLDDVDGYLRKSPGYWYAYVNDVYKDGFDNTPDGLNVIELVDGDTVEFYYAVDIVDETNLTEVTSKATAAVKTVADIETGGPVMDVLYDGTVTLTPGETFNVTAYNSGTPYTVNETTPLGALEATGLSYGVTDKNYATSGALLLDNVGSYLREKTNGIYWYAYVNDEYKDGYNNPAGGLNLIELADGDRVEYYYAAGIADPTDLAAVKASATAAVKTVADIETVPTMDVLFDGTVTLTPGETFNVTAYNSGTPYTVNETTPLGALEKASIAGGFDYDMTDKRWSEDGVLLLDHVDDYLYNSPGRWYAYVNDVFKDGYMNTPDGLNVIELFDGDTAEFYYAADVSDKSDLSEVMGKATAAVKTVASTGVAPTDWTLQLSGARDDSVTKAYFEEGLACDHYVEWTDADGAVWGGIPLWLLVGMVDDDPDPSTDHWTFNDELAAENYEVTVIASDGWDTTLESADIARNDGYIVANTLNGSALPYDGDKPSWPLHLKGPAVFSGQQVGGIVRIELSGLPQPPEGWTLGMLGEVGDVITQSEFEDGLACPGSGHYVEWTDGNGVTWSGVPLWVLLGAVDDIELADHWTFNDGVAATNYSITVIAGDGYSRTFHSDAVARNDDYIVANLKNGTELSESDGYPLKLNGPAIASGKDRIGNIVKIEIVELQTPSAEPGSWNLNLSGKITDVISQAEFKEALACPGSGHEVIWTQEIRDSNGTVIETHEWSGMPLWFLAGWVDDRQPHEFSVTQAAAGYTITVKAGDGYSKEYASAEVAWSDDYIVADMVDGAPLDDSWPLRLVGNAVARANGALSGSSVGNIVEIKLTEFGEPTEIPKLHIVKYAADRTTILNETWIDYLEMQEQFDVIGDGETVYKFQGITMDPEDLWSCGDETKGGFKISNAIKGTRAVDLVSLVGGMGEGTEIVFVADDGYQTTLPYSSIYTTPEIQARQGDAVLAWYADGDYVPQYDDGMRLFFTREDHIYGQCDMKETLPEEYWHYYYQTYSASDPVYGQYAPGILFPSCAGLSAKYVIEIRVYSEPETMWYLDLDGTRVGGITANISKSYFESALACQFGANHEASYTDSSDNVWSGMPLWFLAGFVDDTDQHSDESYNESLAMAGYEILIIGGGDYTKVFDSVPTIRSNDYIVANTKNGASIPESETKNWPLKLVGEGVESSGKLQVGGIHTIILNFRPNITAIDAPATVMVDDEVTVTAYFTDPFDTHTAVFDWGGNQGTTGIVDEEMSKATGSHTYAMAGTYTVNVTVTDSVGASDTKSVSIMVESPPESPYEMTEALMEYIMEDGLPHGTENALLSKLSAAMKFMGDGMMEAGALDAGGNDAYKPKTAINILEAFIHYVEAQDGKKIPSETAMYLIGEVEEIIAMLMEDIEPEAPVISQSQSGTAAGNAPALENGNDPSTGPQDNPSGKKDDVAPSNSNAPSEPGPNGKHLGQVEGSSSDQSSGPSNSDAEETPEIVSSNSEDDAPGSNGNHIGQAKVKKNNGKEK